MTGRRSHGQAPREVLTDANVLLRLITDDPPEMAAAASALAARAAAGELTLRVLVLVIAEMTWVLRSYYGFAPADVAAALARMVTAEGIRVDEEELVLLALGDLGRTGVDFVDALLAQEARAAGIPVCSFDADFDRLGVERLAPR